MSKFKLSSAIATMIIFYGIGLYITAYKGNPNRDYSHDSCIKYK